MIVDGAKSRQVIDLFGGARRDRTHQGLVLCVRYREHIVENVENAEIISTLCTPCVHDSSGKIIHRLLVNLNEEQQFNVVNPALP